MSEVNLKIGPLPDRTPQKLTLLIDPALLAGLEDYARIHSDIHEGSVSVALLAPFMLEAFLESDAGYRKARRKLCSTPARQPG